MDGCVHTSVHIYLHVCLREQGNAGRYVWVHTHLELGSNTNHTERYKYVYICMHVYESRGVHGVQVCVDACMLGTWNQYKPNT